MIGAVILVHLLATVLMTGLIWFVQIVHYPLMAAVGGSAFADYERAHARRTSWIVAPLMLTELATAAWLALFGAERVGPGTAWAGLLLVAGIWLSTALLQVPCHRRLGDGFDAGTWRRLVRSNWLRTAAWSARSALALAMVTDIGAGA